MRERERRREEEEDFSLTRDRKSFRRPGNHGEVLRAALRVGRFRIPAISSGFSWEGHTLEGHRDIGTWGHGDIGDIGYIGGILRDICKRYIRWRSWAESRADETPIVCT